MTESLIGTTLGDFRIEAELGKGGMAVTYRARQLTLERDVALKVLQPSRAQKAAQMQAFVREGRLIAQLEHAYILTVYDAKQVNGHAYLAMRLIETGTLDALLKQPLALNEVALLTGRIAEALDFAHAHEILHLDLKPSNILMGDKSHPYLADFGIAQKIGERAGGNGMVYGTPEYMSPEQCAGEPLDARADVYALGVMVYRMLSGTLPFKAKTTQEMMRQQMEATPTMHAHFSGAVQAVLLKALAKNPADRYVSAGALAQALQHTLTAPAAAAPPHDDALNIRVEVTFRDAPRFERSLPPPSKVYGPGFKCGNCGQSLEQVIEGEPCPVCRKTRPLRW